MFNIDARKMILAFLLIVGVRGGEWLTSRGEYCIDHCKNRGDKASWLFIKSV